MTSAAIMGHLVSSLADARFIFVYDIAMRNSWGITFEKVAVISVVSF